MFNFRVSFCGTSLDISCDDLSSFLFALEESDLAWDSQFTDAQLCLDDMGYPFNDDDFDTFSMMLDETPPEGPVPIQTRVDFDYTEIEEPAEELDDAWISNLDDLRKAMHQIAPPDQYNFEIVLNDCDIPDDETLREMIIGDYMSGFIVTFSNVTKIVRQPSPMPPPPPSPPVSPPPPENEEDVIEPNEEPVRRGSNASSAGGVAAWWDEPDEVKSGSDDDSMPNWYDDDDGDGDDWMNEFFAPDEADFDDEDIPPPSQLDELGSVVEEKKATEDPNAPINGVVPLDEEDDRGPVKSSNLLASGDPKSAHEWDALTASINSTMKNFPSVEDMFSCEVQGEEVVVKDKDTGEQRGKWTIKELRSPKVLKEQLKNEVGAAALVYLINRPGKGGFKRSAFKAIVGVVCRGMQEFGTNWYGAQVIYALLNKKLFLSQLVETIRMKCKDLIKKPQGALTIQYSLQTADVDVNRRPMLLNILLERGNKDKWLQTLLRIAQHSYGSILLQVAMHTMDHSHSHTYFCEPMSRLPPDQLLPLCTHEHGYLFVQAMMVTCLNESLPPTNDDFHDRIWGALKEIAPDLAQNERGRYVLVTALKMSPETHRGDLRTRLENANLLGAIHSLMETQGGPGRLNDVGAAFEGANEMQYGTVQEWNPEKSEGVIDYLGSTLRFYRADLNHVPNDPQPGMRIMFSLSGTGTATNIVFLG